MGRRVTIDPITRLEGHGRIEILLDDDGEVDCAYLQTPDLRGFEKFCQGRAAEEMPLLIQKICGVCPTAHHTASVKALDQLFEVEPTASARLIRELLYCAFIFEDHCLNFYFLGGPDLLVGSGTSRSQRNIFGVLQEIGGELGRRLMAARARVRSIFNLLGGSALFPVHGLPGGVAKPVREEDRRVIRAIATEALEFALETLRLFATTVLPERRFSELMFDTDFSDYIHNLGMVDADGRLSFCEGNLRVINAEGLEVANFAPRYYVNHLVETVDAWSYSKPLHFKDSETQDATLVNGGIATYRVGPLARLNVANGLTTPLAQEESQRMFDHLGGKPAHNLWAYHWARLIEILHAAERMLVITEEEALTCPHIRNMPERLSAEGIGACEAPRGTLIHHYWSDDCGVICRLNLLVATQNNLAALMRSITQAARKFIRRGEVSEGLLNKVEMAFRAYDPCLACAVHALDAGQHLPIDIRDSKRRLIKTIRH